MRRRIAGIHRRTATVRDGMPPSRTTAPTAGSSSLIGSANVSCGIAGQSGSLHDELSQERQGKQLPMGDHVHVRLSQGLSVSESGELIEHSRCRCGATFTKVFDTDGEEPEQPFRS
ncbi:hypothetical protein ACIF8T_39995 [Streptomyces sp. NPDC085946]|uniref:hypothetical protein n=1 Tax=Streptomyces sp. NPDC085946 TaxID=3365744 RepID=UPI0037D15F98